eukprot:4682106-Pleurochrysis_carterae.AAC.2
MRPHAPTRAPHAPTRARAFGCAFLGCFALEGLPPFLFFLTPLALPPLARMAAGRGTLGVAARREARLRARARARVCALGVRGALCAACVGRSV